MSLTQDQIKANLNAMQSQGATDSDIQEYLNTIQSQPTASTGVQPGQATPPSSIANMALGATSIQRGAMKQVAALPWDIASAGKNIANAAGNLLGGIPGIGPSIKNFLTTPIGSPADKSTQTPQVLQPQGTGEQLGSIGAQIAEFFAGAGPEKTAIGSINSLVDGANLEEKFGTAGKLLSGFLKVLGGAGVGSVSNATIAGIQSGGNPQATKTAAEIGGAGGAFAELASTLGPSIAKSLQESVLKLSPQKQSELGAKLGGVLDYLTTEVGPGTPTGQYNKVLSDVNDFENQLQTFLTKDAGNVTVKRTDLISQLQQLKGTFQTERDSLAIDKQIDGMITTLKAKWTDNISVADLNKLKRSTYTNAYNKAGTKVVDWVEAYIGNVFKGSIEDATKGMTIDGKDIAAFNKDYGEALQAKALLKIAKNKNQLGLSGKALLLLLGSPAGLPGEVAGVVLGGSGGVTGALKTGIGAMAQSVSTPIAAANVLSGITTQANPPTQVQQ